MGKTVEVDQKILVCVDTVLQKFGESVKNSIYYYLKKDFNLEKFDIPRKPEAFESALTSIFGEQGSKVIEKLILLEIKSIFNLERDSDLTFNKVVTMIKSLSTNNL